MAAPPSAGNGMVRVREAEEDIDILGTTVMGGKEGMERKGWSGRDAAEAIQLGRWIGRKKRSEDRFHDSRTHRRRMSRALVARGDGNHRSTMINAI